MIAESAPARGASSVGIGGVSKSYVRNGHLMPAISDVSLELAPGEFCSIVGPSGCGKSTLLMMIAGLYLPTSGSISVDGARVTRPLDSVGMVFQRDVLLEWRTVLDNVLLPVEVKRRPKQSYRVKALALLDLVGLRAFADCYPEQLSGGMRQRVAICRAFIHDPPLLLMDEPFGALDEMTRQRLNLELLRIWSERVTTTLLVTHSIAEAVKIGNRILLLSPHPGQVKAELNSVPRTGAGPDDARLLEERIHEMLFAEPVEAAVASA